MKRLAVIGCGLRAAVYMGQLSPESGKLFQLSALADPDPSKTEIYLKHYGNPGTKTFSSGPALLEAMKGKLDAVIIATPNVLHIESAIPAIEQGLAILLEKPVAISVEDCASLWKAYTSRKKPPLAVGFVLRYTAFYKKVKEIIESGEIGQVLAIKASEELGTMLIQSFARGWRRHNSIAGPLILEKCCHDFDIMNWLAASSAMKVSSFAHCTKLIPNPLAAMHCKECKLKDTCRYDVDKITEHVLDGMPADRHEMITALFASHNDICVFNSEKNMPDHQVVNIEYENGILVTLTVAMFQPLETRTIKVYGTAGQIIGSIGEDDLRIRHPAKNSYVGFDEEQVALRRDDSGHHGGDTVINKQLKAMLRDQPVPPLAGLQEGIEGCLVAFAAERSRHEGQVVTMSELRDKALIDR